MVHCEGTTIVIDSEKASFEDKIEIETFLNTLLEEGSTTVYLDLSLTQHLPSELMGFLMWKKKLMEEQNKKLVISKLNANLRHILESALLLEFFGIDQNTEIF
jgi:anti-anti-sigma regulatory factor